MQLQDFANANDLKQYLDLQSEKYYNEGESDITDSEFDALMREYEKLVGGSYDTTTQPPTDPRYAVTEHTFGHLTGRTRKAYNMDEVAEWLAETNPTNLSTTILVTDKYDGNSGTAVFNPDGTLASFLTRGKDGKGLDLTSIFKDRKLPDPALTAYKGLTGTGINDQLALKVEMVMSWDNYQLASAVAEKPYSNPRNMVAGIVRSLKAAERASLVEWAPLRTDTTNGTYSRDEDWEFIQNNLVRKDSLGTISTMTARHFTGTNEELLSQLSAYYDSLVQGGRDQRPFMIDGLVIEYTDPDRRALLGRVGDTNRFDLALKFPNQVQPSTITDIKFYQGKTGRVTPVAVFEPVCFNGAKCDHVSLSNYSRFLELSLGVGSHVLIEYHGDVLSYLVRDPAHPDDPSIQPIPFIETCPSCKSDLYTNDTETFIFCNNPTCPSNVVGRLVNWCEKMGLKGINEATLEKLNEAGLVNSVVDLYKVTPEEGIAKGVFKEKGAKVFTDALAMNLNSFDYEVLGSLMFQSLGRTKMKEICKVYTYDELLSFTDLELAYHISQIPGMGDLSTQYFVEGRNTYRPIMEELKDILTIKTYKSQMKTAAEPMKVVFTGFRDKDLKDKLELNGHKVTGSTSSKTTVVVAADPSSGSSSIKKAKELNIPVLTVAEFKDKYGY